MVGHVCGRGVWTCVTYLCSVGCPCPFPGLDCTCTANRLPPAACNPHHLMRPWLGCWMGGWPGLCLTVHCLGRTEPMCALCRRPEPPAVVDPLHPSWETQPSLSNDGRKHACWCVRLPCPPVLRGARACHGTARVGGHSPKAGQFACVAMPVHGAVQHALAPALVQPRPLRPIPHHCARVLSFVNNRGAWAIVAGAPLRATGTEKGWGGRFPSCPASSSCR